ncbi:hypothetical protein [Bordetella bronchiseptica]|uniref:hypothetical protein n=1 Tax=Bordetella bronchiseptica TaxID=518 RepID=UPI000460B391|nr:hypothetical protein [Bordetella bronchiseptica]KDC65752.1 hypothetical protein L510_3714 [Bordetella bronchiseptica MBORD591]
MSRTEQALELVRARPGIRSVEIEEELGISGATTVLASAVQKGLVRAERVQAPSGRWVAAFYPADHEPTDDRDISVPRQVRTAVPSATAEGLVAALFTNGDLVLEVGRRSIRLNADQTRRLVQYLDRINVDQIMAGVSK